MGSPSGPLFANIFKRKIQRKELGSEVVGLDFYCCSPDDVYVASSKTSDLSELLRRFSCPHTSTQFPMEMERNGFILFLDVYLSRNEGGLNDRSGCRRTTWVGQYINFYRQVPLSSKRNPIRRLAHPAGRLCSPAI